MDKQLLKAYIRTIVEEEVKRLLPELLSEAVTEIKQLSEQTPVRQTTKPKIDRSKLAAMMGIEYDGETLRATSTDKVNRGRLPDEVPPNADPEVIKAINRDYSQMMKKMGIV